jgi:hypothetical protein
MNRMHSIRTLGLAVVAVCLLGAVAAASASASQPKFEPESAKFPISFSASGGASKLETVGGTEVSCTKNSVTGAEIANEHAVKKIKIAYTGCTAFFGLATCTTSGQASGTILTNELQGELEYIGASKNEVGVAFWPTASKAKGTAFATFGCAGTTVSVKNGTANGGVVCKITPLNTFTTTSTLACTQTKGVQSPSEYWNPTGCTKVEDFLESEGVGGIAPFGLQKSAVQGTSTVTTAAKVKIVSSSCT